MRPIAPFGSEFVPFQIENLPVVQTDSHTDRAGGWLIRLVGKVTVMRD